VENADEACQGRLVCKLDFFALLSFDLIAAILNLGQAAEVTQKSSKTRAVGPAIQMKLSVIYNLSRALAMIYG
jgi:hypothetical protein